MPPSALPSPKDAAVDFQYLADEGGHWVDSRPENVVGRIERLVPELPEHLATRGREFQVAHRLNPPRASDICNSGSTPSTFYSGGADQATAAPSITGLTPTSGAVGTAVTISGSDFE